MTIKETIQKIGPLDSAAMKKAQARWDAIAKPLHGLGKLEDLLVQIAGITASAAVDCSKRTVTVFCADNGVIAEGVTQAGQEVTAMVADSLARGETSVNRMAQTAHADVFVVDIGIACETHEPDILCCKISPGTKNIAKEPAMSREQAQAALLAGVHLAQTLKKEGYRLLAAGEMGIGNTTTSSAVASVLLGCDPAEVTGRGAGLSSQGLERKTNVIRSAIALHQPDSKDALDVLAKVGGFDLAGLCGFYLGAAVCRVPVILDGVISAAAALCAARICPQVKSYLLASHLSAEPAARLLLKELGCEPVIQANLSLGEGTGAVALLPLLDMACAVYNGVPTFEQHHMEAYQPLT